MLPPALQPGQFDPATEPEKQAKFRRKVADVQHLVGHLMSGNDYFITSDEDDMLKPLEESAHPRSRFHPRCRSARGA
ncbi:hypothetical protein [Actinoplanes aureus]|uniref:Uncharacterized protein n=1 Tax=Actinoplanes aureus TaxID=2792083 RepID=A0A931C9A7_9ACTN|nr:hypothetical protein [Actinoplanes aureus]MBG0560710.1 hypothetical protein [Actinoplanes aureus]